MRLHNARAKSEIAHWIVRQASRSDRARADRVATRLGHNDELRPAFARCKGPGGAVGLFVDRSGARFDNVRLRTLKKGGPEQS